VENRRRALVVWHFPVWFRVLLGTVETAAFDEYVGEFDRRPELVVSIAREGIC